MFAFRSQALICWTKNTQRSTRIRMFFFCSRQYYCRCYKKILCNQVDINYKSQITNYILLKKFLTLLWSLASHHCNVSALFHLQRPDDPFCQKMEKCKPRKNINIMTLVESSPQGTSRGQDEVSLASQPPPQHHPVDHPLSQPPLSPH